MTANRFLNTNGSRGHCFFRLRFLSAYGCMCGYSVSSSGTRIRSLFGTATLTLLFLSGGALTSVPKMCPFWASSSGSLSATDKPLPLHTARTEAGLHGLPHLCLLFSCFSPNWSDSFSRSEAWSIGSRAYYIRPGSSKSPRHKAHDYLLNAKW